MKLFAVFDSSVKVILPFYGVLIRANGKKATDELGIVYRPVKETFLDCVESLIDHGAIKKKTK